MKLGCKPSRTGGCAVYTDTITISQINLQKRLENIDSTIHTESAKIEMQVYPNPNDGSFYLDILNGGENENGTVTIYNLMGVELQRIELSLTAGNNNFRLTTGSSISSGLYLVKLNSGTELLHKTITIQK